MSDSVRQHCNRTGTILWDSNHFEIGSGYDIPVHNIARSPFVRFSASTAFDREGAEIVVSRKLFRNESDTKSSLQTATSMSASYLSAVSSRACATSLKSAKCNETNMMNLTHFTISVPAQHFKHELKFTSEATSCLNKSKLSSLFNNPAQTFMARYGQYAITGQARRATLLIISKYSSKSKESLDTFVSEFGAGFDGKMVSVDAATGLTIQKSARKLDIEEHHDVFCVGYDANHVYMDYKDVDPKVIWKGFLQHYHPVPYLAMLTHYCDLVPDGQIPVSIAVLDLPLHVATAIRKCIFLQIAARSSQILAARNLDSQLDTIYDSLMAAGPLSSRKPPDMDNLLAQLDSADDEMKLWAKRTSLLDALEVAYARDIKQIRQERCAERRSDTVWKRWDKSHSQEWVIGIDMESVERQWPDLVGDVWLKEEEEWRRLNLGGRLPACLEEVVLSSVPGYIVIGAKITSYRTDGNNGWWYRSSANGKELGALGTDSFGVRFRTSHYRDGQYQLITYSVPKEMYERCSS